MKKLFLKSTKRIKKRGRAGRFSGLFTSRKKDQSEINVNEQKITKNPKKLSPLNLFWMRRGRAPLWVRLLSLSVVWTIVVLLLGGIILSVTFRSAMEENFNNRLTAMMDNLVRITTVDMDNVGTALSSMSDVRFQDAYSGWYWQISVKGFTPMRSESLWDQTLSPNLDVAVPNAIFYEAEGPENQKLKIIERDIKIGENDIIYRYSVGVDLSEIKQQIVNFDRILFIALAVLGGGLLLVSSLQVMFGLQPLGQIRKILSKIRTGEETHLPNDLPSEIRPLAEELNALIDHNNEIVERSRTQVGNLAHALKTPLAVILNEASLSSKDQAEDLNKLVAEQVEIMRRQVEYYLRRARMVASNRVINSRTEVLPVIENIKRAMTILARDKIFTLSVLGEGGVSLPEGGARPEFIFKGERQDLEDMVGNLLENAAKWASSQVGISCFKSGGMLHIIISDDGVGIRPSVRDAVFSRGERLDENMPGTGLGLSIVKDLVGLYDGEIILRGNKRSDNNSNKNNGLVAELILPIP